MEDPAHLGGTPIAITVPIYGSNQRGEALFRYRDTGEIPLDGTPRLRLRLERDRRLEGSIQWTRSRNIKTPDERQN